MPDTALFDLISPRFDERGALVGTTGSGKTTLARAICNRFENVAIIDPKGMINWPGYVKHRSLDRLVKEESTRLIYAPDHDELIDEDAIEGFFSWVYQRGNFFVYIDEVGAITFGDTLPRSYHACLTRGREKGIGTLSATQRPRKIPQVIFSESEFFYIFRLSLETDRTKIWESTGIAKDAIAALPKRRFLAFSFEREGIPSRPMMLDIGGTRNEVENARSSALTVN